MCVHVCTCILILCVYVSTCACVCFQLTLAIDHGLEPKELSKIYFSVAETLSDNGQHDEALGYYDKELDMWSGHPAEVWLYPSIMQSHN